MTIEEGEVKNFDELRRRQIAYEYLCHLEEAKVWLEHILKIELPPSSDLEYYMRNGVVLAKLGLFTSPKVVNEKKIYDIDMKKYEGRGLHFKHTDNINLFLTALKAVGLPKIFYPETNDIYGLKNPVRMIYCIHALSHLLAKQGRAPLIKNLFGQVEFSEEDINKVQSALDKYGIKMPVFSKIGGILAGELTEDDAAIHAGIIKISEALDLGDLNILLERLNNPVLRLLRVYPTSIQDYFNSLKNRKDKKVQLASTKNAGNEEDLYDRILSLSEIQDSINQTNLKAILNNLNQALRKKDHAKVAECFISPDLGDVHALAEYKDKYAEFGASYFVKFNNESDLSIDDVRSIISGVNDTEKKAKEAKIFVTKMEQLIANKDMDGILIALKHPPEDFTVIETDHKEFVYGFLSNLKNANGGSLDRESLSGGLNILAIVCQINKCIENRNDLELYQQLQNPLLGLSELDTGSAGRYLEAMVNLKKDKENRGCIEGGDLLLEEIVSCVNNVNKFVQEELGKLEIVTKINENLSNMQSDELIALLTDSRGKFKNVIVENKNTYLQALKARKLELEYSKQSDTRCLWHNNVQDIIDEFNSAMILANSRVKKIDALNESLISHTNCDMIVNFLSNLEISGIIGECSSSYYESLCDTVNKRNVSQWNGWVEHSIRTSKDHKFYYNHKDNQMIWFNEPKEYDRNLGYLNANITQEVCSRIGSQYNREMYFRSNIVQIDLIQSFYRAYSTYNGYRKHLLFIHKELPNVLILQSYVRMILHRKKFYALKKLCADNVESVELIKAYGRTVLKLINWKRKCGYYKANQDNIVAIQSLIRCNLAQNDYNNLFHLNNPSLKRVYKYINLLELDANDYLEERELAKLKNLVFDKIKEDAELEEELKAMDLKIGLLVKNRINLSETMNMGSKTKKRSNQSQVNTGSLTIEKLQLRNKYGQLFYILQYFPIYWAKILMPLSGSHSAKYVRELTLSLFNLGTTSRDEYFMLRAFEVALDFEIKEKIDSLKDFNRDDPTVTKIVISFYRDKKAPTFLQPILSEPVNEVMAYKGTLTNNPVDLYKQHVSKIESETGQSSGLPYDVDAEKALEVEEVRNLLNKNIEVLVQLTIKFRDSIISNISLIPFGIKYYAKTIYECVSKKFEGSPEEEILKIVGNLIYYRFFNPAIVLPDGHGLWKGKGDVSTEQRRNLAFVSNVLHNCSVNKLFESPIPQMKPLDDVMRESVQKFMAFFKKTIDVESLEQHFKVNEFSDHTTLQKPELKLSCGQILEVHSLLKTHADILPTADNDYLLATVNEIGEIPKLTDLIDYRAPPTVKGEAQVVENEEDVLSNTVITLTLVPPKLLTESDESKNKELLSKTLFMFADILRFHESDSVTEVLKATFTSEQEQEYAKLLNQRQSLCASETTNDTSNIKDNVSQALPLTLAETLQQINQNLTVLEEAKIITPDEDHKSVLLALLKLILQRSNYIKSRKIDMARYRSTLENLDSKRTYMLKQMESYNLYIKGCVANMSQKKKNKKIVVKKSAFKLHKMGVLIEIDGLASNKYKNVNFEFSTTDEPGKFQVSGHLLGVEMNRCDIEFDELLHCKFNNTHFIKLSGVATVNVSLLIYFLNQNFYIQK